MSLFQFYCIIFVLFKFFVLEIVDFGLIVFCVSLFQFYCIIFVLFKFFVLEIVDFGLIVFCVS
ncbi:hypothetical protein, partial [Streptomyces sp. JV184]|uniref:hypothetical protein n=1 Tax=Streptomyces sp. JV184 TaxID=858637 RepID=UPI002E78F674